jgi:DNA-binding NtrC family response regulator
MAAEQTGVEREPGRAMSESDVLDAEIRAKQNELVVLSRRFAQLRATAARPDRPVVGLDREDGGAAPATAARPVVVIDDIVPLAEVERRYVLEVLRRYDGNRTHTARALRIGTNTLWRKLKAWGEPPARG